MAESMPDLLTRVMGEIARLYPELDADKLRDLQREMGCTNKRSDDSIVEAATGCTTNKNSTAAAIETSEAIGPATKKDEDVQIKALPFEPSVEVLSASTRTVKKKAVEAEEITSKRDLLLRFVAPAPVKRGRMKTFSTPVPLSTDCDFKPAVGSTAYENEFLASLSETYIAQAGITRSDEAVQYLKHFHSKRPALVQRLLQIYNEHVFDKRLPEESLTCIWNVRLTKTAGYCTYTWDSNGQKTAKVELSEKVCDNAERVRDTLIHELCHAAAWILHGHRGAHDAVWKYWTARSVRILPALPPIRRCHAFEVHAKYVYTCVNCGQQIRRHSKSLDTQAKVCGVCHGRFQLSENKPGPSGAPSSTPNPRPTPKFALFVKSHYKQLKEKKPSSTHKEIMQSLGESFKKLDFGDGSQV